MNVKCKRCNSVIDIPNTPIMTRVNNNVFYLCDQCKQMLKQFLENKNND